MKVIFSRKYFPVFMLLGLFKDADECVSDPSKVVQTRVPQHFGESKQHSSVPPLFQKFLSIW